MVRKRTIPRRDAGRARGESVSLAILTATLEELAVSGVEGLSVERVAVRAEVNKTSIYRRWPTRDELVVAALEQATAEVTALPETTASLRGDLLALLKRVAELQSHPVGRALMHIGFIEAVDSPIAMLARTRLTAQAMLPVQTLVDAARARGEWRDDAKGEQLIFALVGAVMHRVNVEHGKVSSAWLSSLVDLVLLGVLPR